METHTQDGSNGLTIQQTSDGGYILMGYHNDSIGFATTDNALLIKTDPIGDIVWTKSFGNWINNISGYQIGQQTNDGVLHHCRYSK
ncbi:MAG: hypothetical protein IPK10_13080 [Bacteroidetes bacterium]|nr:hypothetical protein [Bacteroidota bacterium]